MIILRDRNIYAVILENPYRVYLGMEEDLSYLNIRDLPVHGGITYNGDGESVNMLLLENVIPPDHYVVGWDYNHYGDDEKDHGISSIIEEIKNTIAYLREVGPMIKEINKKYFK